MGDEAGCTLRRDGTVTDGRAHLEPDRVLFRGPEGRATILLSEVSSVSVTGGGDLELRLASGPVTLGGLGPKAARWANAIRSPKSVLEKLGVKAGMRVALVEYEDPSFAADLAGRGVELAPEGAGDCDAVFFLAHDPAALGRLPALRERLAPAGALWVLRPKGPRSPVGEMAVIDAGKAAGLVDIKVVAFSPTLSAAKLVIPVAQRAGMAPATPA